ncbi:MAG TPA: class I adenylate-forming enzyme family protein, partial [Ktedonobacterales bacterium]|nr:class I adenylate-forming enzyme family protein [Ktedonobacterales bacterium]
MILADLIERNAAFAPDKCAARYQGETWTYGLLADRIATFARALKSQLDVRRGDRVAVLALNHPHYLALLYACARLGAILVPLNWRLAVPEQMFILSDASVKALFVAKEFATVCEALAAAHPDTQIVGLDYTPEHGVALTDALAGAGGDGRNPNVEWRTP